MNQLQEQYNTQQFVIDINYSDPERITVSARELHDYLDASERFNSWFERFAQYGFIKGVDYTPVKSLTEVANNGGTQTMNLDDFQITIEMAKQICMLQRSDKGTATRQYFIQLEKDWNSPEKTMARALFIADTTIKDQKNLIESLKPKAQYADLVSGAENSILVRDLAKLLNQGGYKTGEKRLYETLRADGYLIDKGVSHNTPTQRAMDMGLFAIRQSAVVSPEGHTRTVATTKVTQRGVQFFTDKYCAKS